MRWRDAAGWLGVCFDGRDEWRVGGWAWLVKKPQCAHQGGREGKRRRKRRGKALNLDVVFVLPSVIHLWFLLMLDRRQLTVRPAESSSSSSFSSSYSLLP